MIKFRKCPVGHNPGQDINKHYLWYIDKKGNHVYDCKQCLDDLNNAIARDEKIREHNRIQEEKSMDLYNKKRAKKRAKILQSRQNDIWDDEIKKELTKGMKLNNKEKYKIREYMPKDLLSLKRASMKLQRLIKTIKDTYKSQQEKEEEERKKLLEPVRTCIKHGNLFIGGLIKSGYNKNTGFQYYKCRECMREAHKKNYSKNKKHVLEKCSKYRKNNPDKIKEIREKYKEKLNGKNYKHERIAR